MILRVEVERARKTRAKGQENEKTEGRKKVSTTRQIETYLKTK